MRRRLVAALGLLLLLAGIGPVAAQGDDQQSMLARVISKALSSPDGQVRIGAVEGALSSNAVIRDVEISDQRGPWLRVDRARLVWKRAALLLRRLEVEQLEIGRVEVLRKPDRSAPSQNPSAADAEPLLPELPVKVIVAGFSVGELVLGETVAGAPARLGLSGNVSLGAPSEGLQATLAARRLDRDGALDLRLAFVPKGETLDLALRHRESAGGLVAHLMDITGRPAVELDVSGAGPLDNWQARLGFSAGDVARASGQASILRQGTARRIDLDLNGHLEGLLPPVAATIFAGQTRLSGALTLADDGAMALSALRLASDQAELTVSGSLDKSRQMDVQAVARSLGTARAGARRVAALKTLALDVRATGPLAAPRLRGRLDAEISHLDAFADDLGLPLRGAAKLGAEVSGTPTDKTLDATFALEATGLDLGQPRLAMLLGSKASLSGKARLRGEQVTAEAVALKGQRVDARLDATLDRTSGGARGTARLAGRLDGRPLAGAAEFETQADGTIDLGRLDLALGSGTVRGAVKLAPGGTATGALSANLPDLAAVSALAGLPLRGAVSGDVALSAPNGTQAAAVTAKGRNLAGFGASVATFDAEANLTGDLARPTGQVRAGLSGVQHPEAQRAGVARLDVKVNGRLAGDHAVVTATIGGGPHLQIGIRGSAPLSAQGKADLAVTGTIDAALANARLTGGAQRVTGQVGIDATVRGTLAHPAIEGAATLRNGSFVDLLQGTRLEAISGRVVGSGQTVRIDSLTATTPGGGRISVNGSVQVDAGRGFPASLRLTGDNARLMRNGVVDLVTGLDLAISGPLVRTPLVTGLVTIVSLDVAIPDRLPADAAPLARAKHLSPPEQTRERLKVVARQNARKAARQNTAGGGPRLSVKVSAPSHIFVRGRGIDAELGGEVTVSGPLTAPRADGAFELRRGQLDMLTQRLEFSRGRLTFFGDLMPELDFVAATSAGGVTAKVSVTGRADAPVFTLSSEPQLPPDEVLARLMFERAAGSLSPLQAVQLAQAVARLTGNGGPDMLDKTRRALGVDTLDVSAGKDGPTVGASRYIARGVRLGVKAGATPEQSGVTANIDLGRRIKLQGETSASGRTSLGIGAEIEY